jgi:hypothetical protein
MVMKTFLLRFEEKTVRELGVRTGRQSVSARGSAYSNEAASTIVAGTQTLTEVRHEGVDEDPDRRGRLAFPR